MWRIRAALAQLNSKVDDARKMFTRKGWQMRQNIGRFAAEVEQVVERNQGGLQKLAEEMRKSKKQRGTVFRTASPRPMLLIRLKSFMTTWTEWRDGRMCRRYSRGLAWHRARETP